MSAFVCEIELFHYLMAAYRRTHRVKNMEPHERDALTNATGQMLLDANYASVNQRYDEREEPESYRYDRRFDEITISPLQVLKSAHCLNYQSCEFKGWEKTDAYRFLLELTWGEAGNLRGYDDAAWGCPSIPELGFKGV